MDFVARIIFLALAFYAPSLFAADYSYYSQNQNGTGITASDAVTACKLVYPSLNMVRADYGTSGGYNCVYRDSAGKLFYSGAVYGQNCQSGTSYISGSCKSDPAKCVSRQGKEWVAPSVDGAWNSGKRVSFNFCPQTGGTTTCVVRGSVTYTSSAGDNYIAGPWSYTGGTCANDGLGTGPTEAPSPCPKGKCPGTVNGAQVCVACSSVSEQKTTTSSNIGTNTPLGGSASTSSGSSSSTTSTTCSGNQCTTTTSTQTTNTDGSSSQGTATKTEPKSDFCASNPKAEACKESGGGWGGSCGSFVCDGDAVQCAQAQAAWKSACALDIDATDTKAVAGNAALSAGVRSAEHPGNNPDVKAFSASLNTTNPYGTACPSDIALNAYGHSVNVPLSSACDVFTWMGRLAVALALVAAGRIVFA